MIDAAGGPQAIALDATSYVASAISLVLIRQKEAVVEVGRAPVLAEVREGIGLVFGSPILRAFAGCMATSNLSTSVFFALYVLYGTRELGLGATVLGLVYGAGVGGAVVGSAIAERVMTRIGIGRAMIGSAFLGSFEVLPAALATPDLAVPLLLVSSLLGNFGWSLYNVGELSLRQALVPASHQGRLNATMGFLVAGLIPLGGLLGGALGEWIGLQEAIALSAAGSLFSFVWVLVSPVRGLRQVPRSGV